RNLHSFPTRRSSDLDDFVHAFRYKLSIEVEKIYLRITLYVAIFKGLPAKRPTHMLQTLHISKVISSTKRSVRGHNISLQSRVSIDRKSTRLNSSHVK